MDSSAVLGIAISATITIGLAIIAWTAGAFKKHGERVTVLKGFADSIIALEKENTRLADVAKKTADIIERKNAAYDGQLTSISILLAQYRGGLDNLTKESGENERDIQELRTRLEKRIEEATKEKQMFVDQLHQILMKIK